MIISYSHTHDMDGPNISSIYVPLDFDTTIGKNTLAGAVSKLVERDSTTNTALITGCSSFPNPLAKMRLHWVGPEKRTEDTLFESLTTLVLGKLLKCL